MTASVIRRAAAFIAMLCLSVAVGAQTPKMGPAQSPATNAIDADYAKQQQERQLTQPLNNQPVWSEVRSGSPQFTSLPGRETNVLIQPEGQTWRALRNSQVRSARRARVGALWYAPRALPRSELQAPKKRQPTLNVKRGSIGLRRYGSPDGIGVKSPHAGPVELDG